MEFSEWKRVEKIKGRAGVGPKPNIKSPPNEAAISKYHLTQYHGVPALTEL
jgi:hypothetical protein